MHGLQGVLGARARYLLVSDEGVCNANTVKNALVEELALADRKEAAALAPQLLADAWAWLGCRPQLELSEDVFAHALTAAPSDAWRRLAALLQHHQVAHARERERRPAPGRGLASARAARCLRGGGGARGADKARSAAG